MSKPPPCAYCGKPMSRRLWRDKERTGQYVNPGPCTYPRPGDVLEPCGSTEYGEPRRDPDLKTPVVDCLRCDCRSIMREVERFVPGSGLDEKATVYGYNGDGYFCSLRCGYWFAIREIKAAGG